MLMSRSICRLNNQNGLTTVVVAIAMVALIGFGALAVDLGYLYIVKGELQNAADSGALAGARVLYIDDATLGAQVNPSANQTALDLVSANYSEKSSVTVQSIERGHWSFATKTFTPNDSLLSVSLVNVSTAELDANVNFINAVRVVTTRKVVAGTGLPAEPFFAKIFGIQGTPLVAVAVAYIGYTGSLNAGEADQPIVICEHTLRINGEYSCNIGRMLTDGSDTAGWTDFSQTASCDIGDSSSANASTVNSLVCAGGNPGPIVFGNGITTVNGVMASPLDTFRDCWKAYINANGMTAWSMTLAVVQCDDGKLGGCRTVVGAVDVEIVWVTGNGNDPTYGGVPTKMEDWTGAPITGGTASEKEAQRKANWNSFVDRFNLTLPDGQPSYWQNKYGANTWGYSPKTIYFKPSCKARVPAGITGGQNSGVLAKIPLLVK